MTIHQWYTNTNDTPPTTTYGEMKTRGNTTYIYIPQVLLEFGGVGKKLMLQSRLLAQVAREMLRHHVVVQLVRPVEAHVAKRAAGMALLHVLRQGGVVGVQRQFHDKHPLLL